MTAQESSPALPGEECQVPPHECWSDLEKWVWHEVGSGRIADINTKLGKPADPKTPEDWVPERRLSARFLETILLHDPWRNVIPRQGVRVCGAWLNDSIDLSHALISALVIIHRCRMDADLRLVGSEFARHLIVVESVLDGEVRMDSVLVNGPLLLRSNTIKNVDLRHANINGQLSLQ